MSKNEELIRAIKDAENAITKALTTLKTIASEIDNSETDLRQIVKAAIAEHEDEKARKQFDHLVRATEANCASEIDNTIQPLVNPHIANLSAVNPHPYIRIPGNPQAEANANALCCSCSYCKPYLHQGIR